jgi:protein gp37
MVASPRSSFETTRYGPVVADRTTIEWTEATWNPVTGCSKVSSGCKHCYAETLAERFRGVPGHPFEQGFDLRLWPERLEVPRRWRQPRLVFVNSMSDLFHPGVPDAFIADVFTVMEREHRHTFQVLTKRPERAASFAVELPWPPNVWLGTSIEDERVLARADVLRTVPAAVRFVSAEPLLGPLGRLDLTSIDWLIAGGESGPRRRPIEAEWVRSLRDRCLAAGVAFFFKQWGGRSAKANGRLLDGREWSQMPPT